MKFAEQIAWYKDYRKNKHDYDDGRSEITLFIEDYDWLVKYVEDQHRDIMRIKKGAVQ